MTVTNGYRCVAELLLHHQLSHWLAHDVRTAEYHTLLATGLYLIVLQQRQNTQRCSRDKARQADSHSPHIDRMESIHILAIINRLDDFLLIDMFRQRQLDDEAIHVFILI